MSAPSIFGDLLELQFHRKGVALLSGVLRHARLIEPSKFEEILGLELSDEDALAIESLDFLIAGISKREPGRPTIWVALHVAGIIDEREVIESVSGETALLRNGYRCVPAVVGYGISDRAEVTSRNEKVVTVMDGIVTGWEEALAKSLRVVEPREAKG